MQNFLKDGRLKFVDKRKSWPEEDVKTKVEALFVEPIDIMVVDTVDEARAKDNKENYEDEASKVYLKAEEELIDFLNCYRLKYSEGMLCPRCSSMFDKEAANELERINPYQAKKFFRHDKPKELFSSKGKGPIKL